MTRSVRDDETAIDAPSGASVRPSAQQTRETTEITRVVGPNARGPFAPGTMVGHFQVMRRIGHGGMGEVHLARDLKLGRKVALKVVHPKELDSQQTMNRFMVEARLIARFNHPHIVTLYEVGVHEGRPYLALEYLEGEDLASRMRQRALSVLETVRIALAVAEALAEAHSHGVLHRDLKPGNVMIGRDGRARVLDFGLSKTLEHIAPEGEPSPRQEWLADDGGALLNDAAESWGFGTPRYLAPEQWMDQPASTASDVWALGVLLYCMLTRRLPFSGRGLGELARQVCHQQPPPIDEHPDLDPNLEELLASCLHKDPAERPTAKQAAALLDALLQMGTQIQLTEDNPFRGLLPFSSKHAASFFGRDPEIASFVERVRVQTILPVLGPSGAGKSSFVRAGIIPRLQEQAPWMVLDLRPGARPFRALALRLLRGEDQGSVGGFSFRRLLRGSYTRSSRRAGRSSSLRSRRRSSMLPPPSRPASSRSGAPAPDSSSPASMEPASPGLGSRGPSSASLPESADFAADEAATRAERPTQQPRDEPAQGEHDPDGLASTVQREHRPGLLAELERLEQAQKAAISADAQQSQTQTITQPIGAQPSPTGPHSSVFVRMAVDQDVAELTADDARVQQAAELLRQEPARLGIELRALAAECQANVLLFVDQLEELFTLCDSPDIRGTFLEALCMATDDELDPVRVIFSVRDDFLGRIATSARMREVLSRVVVVQRPDEQALTDILLRPVEQSGHRYDDPELVRDIVAEVRGEPACLPLVQFAAHQLWERRDKDNRLLTRSAYTAMGGVEGALARHADGVIQGLAVDSARHVRTLLLRMVTPERTRRVVSRMHALQGLPPSAAMLLTQLTEARLVTASKVIGEHGVETMLELAHESLITAWARLSRWIDEGREDLLFLAEVGQAAELWDRRGRRDDELWQTDGLRECLRSMARVTSEVPPLVTAFVEASQRRERSRVRRRRFGYLAGVLLLAAVAVGATMLALFVRAQRDVARDQEADALREGARAALAQGDVLQARAKLRHTLEGKDSIVARALWWQLHQEPRLWTKQLGSPSIAVALSPDGSSVAAVSQNGLVYLFDVITGRTQILRGHEDQAISVTFSADGKLVAAGGLDKTVRIWQVADGKPQQVLRGHKSGTHGVSFRHDGKQLATGGYDGTARIFDVASGEEKLVLKGHKSAVRGVAFSGDGLLIATAGSDRTARLWDAASGKQQAVLSGHQREVYAVAFSPDSKQLATSSYDGKIRLWEVRSSKLLKTFEGHRSGVSLIAFSGDGKQLASSSADRTARLWDIASGEQRWLVRQDAQVTGVALSGDGDRLATSNAAGEVTLFDLTVERAQDDDVAGHGAAVGGATLSPDGRFVVSGGLDNRVLIWSVQSGRVVQVLSGHQDGVGDVVYSPDGKLIASAGKDRTIRLWDANSGEPGLVLAGHQAEVFDLAFSHDGTRLASGSYDQTVRLWDVAKGRQLVMFGAHTDRIGGVAFSPNDKLLATTSYDRTLRVWDLKEGKTIRLLRGHEHRIYGVDFSPDGTTLATASYDTTLRLWDIQGRTNRLYQYHPGRIYGVSYHPDGRRIGVASATGNARIWNLDDNSHTLLSGHHNEVNTIRFDKRGELAVTSSDDGTVRVWDVASGRPRWRAPALVTGHGAPKVLTHAGWLGFDGAAAAAPEADWAKQLETHARHATLSPDGELLCVERHDGHVELWRSHGDKIGAHPIQGVTALAAADAGCVAGDGQAAWLLPKQGGAPQQLSAQGEVQAIGSGEGMVLLATAERVFIYDGTGKLRSEHPVAGGVTALTLRGPQLLLGYADGNLDVVSTADGSTQPFRFEAVPASPVTALLSGPPGTVIAGYANGLLGLWDSDRGARLAHTQLHGPIVHARMADAVLLVASQLGHFTRWDLSPFHTEYCQLLRSVWERVPVAWRRGHAVVEPPPARHGCRAR